MTTLVVQNYEQYNFRFIFHKCSEYNIFQISYIESTNNLEDFVFFLLLHCWQFVSIFTNEYRWELCVLHTHKRDIKENKDKYIGKGKYLEE